MDCQVVEINEAIEAGNMVIDDADDLIESLNSASTWGFLDLFSNNSFISSFIKHSKLDDAQVKLNRLRNSLERFGSELDDVRVYCNIDNVNCDELIKMFDIFFDNIFVDIYTLSKISDSKREIENIKNETKRIVKQLEGEY